MKTETSSNFIKPIDLAQVDETAFKLRYVSCVVLTHAHKILLQQRGNDWITFPGYLSTFGGKIEAGESPLQALIRELAEELGAEVAPNDVISLGVYTEAVTKHSELIYGYFWHDKHGTITGCYEGEARQYENYAAVVEHPRIMDDVLWLLKECQKKKLLKTN